MILLDTSALVYAAGGDHPYRRPCRKIVDLIGDGTLSATTTPEVIQEFAHVLARRRPREQVLPVANDFAELLAPLRCSDEDHLADGLELWRRYETLGAFDAVLATVALDSKYATLVSADQAFAQIPGLHHVLPDENGIADLIGTG